MGKLFRRPRAPGRTAVQVSPQARCVPRDPPSPALRRKTIEKGSQGKADPFPASREPRPILSIQSTAKPSELAVAAVFQRCPSARTDAAPVEIAS